MVSIHSSEEDRCDEQAATRVSGGSASHVDPIRLQRRPFITTKRLRLPVYPATLPLVYDERRPAQDPTSVALLALHTQLNFVSLSRTEPEMLGLSVTCSSGIAQISWRLGRSDFAHTECGEQLSLRAYMAPAAYAMAECDYSSQDSTMRAAQIKQLARDSTHVGS